MSRVIGTLALLLSLSVEAQTRTLGTFPLDGSGSGGGGSGDITDVNITTSSPLTGTASCTTGACSFTLGLGTVTVAKGGTGLTAGTDGGILGYTATGTLASSIALTLHALLVGGGAGATPTPLGSLGTSTQVLHGAAAGDPTWGAIVNADITNATIDLTTKVTGILPSANGGTGNGFAKLSGPTTSEKTFTLPNANATLLYDGGSVATQTVTTSLSLGDGAVTKLIVPTVDGTSSGPSTCSFNSGYSSSAIGDLVYLDSSATWQKADADASATTYSGLLAMAMEVKASGAALCVALPGSYVYAAAAFPTFTIGGVVYMSATAGAVTQTQPTGTDTAIRVIGFAVHADKVLFNPARDYITLN